MAHKTTHGEVLLHDTVNILIYGFLRCFEKIEGVSGKMVTDREHILPR